jgi:hypothetical protein
VNTGWFLDGKPNGYRLPPPRLGAQRDEVISEWLGLKRNDHVQHPEEGAQ